MLDWLIPAKNCHHSAFPVVAVVRLGMSAVKARRQTVGTGRLIQQHSDMTQRCGTRSIASISGVNENREVEATSGVAICRRAAGPW